MGETIFNQAKEWLGRYNNPMIMRICPPLFKHFRKRLVNKQAYRADGFTSSHNHDFIRDPLFSEAYRLGMNTGHRFGDGLRIEWRVMVACWAAANGKRLGGDFVECGVNTGILSRAAMHYIDFSSMSDRKFYLLDTYTGIPESSISDSERVSGIGKMNDYYFDCYSQVKETFSSFDNAIIIKGTIPDTLSQVTSDKICYLSIDMNCSAPEIAAGEYFWPRMVQGATIVLDDYGQKSYIEQKHAWDKFALHRGVSILPLPTGQGILIKS